MSRDSDTLFRSPSRKGSSARRDIWLGVGGLLLVALLSLGLLTLLNAAGAGRTPLSDVLSPTAQKPISITLAHTNDTLGYVDPCG
jgi:hypothetical protein